MKPAFNLVSCIVGNVGVRFLKRRKNNWIKKVDKSHLKHPQSPRCNASPVACFSKPCA